MCDIKKALLDKISEYETVIISRHARPDGDAVGSSLGLKKILENAFPEKRILLINSDYAEYLSFIGTEDEDVSPDEYKNALGITLDTATADRVSNKQIYNCKEVIKIDHHPDVEGYSGLQWIDEKKSSASEMVADFALSLGLEITPEAARPIYLGMVTDSGRFRFRSVSGDTMRIAGALLDIGIDTDVMYSNLYIKDFSTVVADAELHKRIKRTENGVAYLYLDKKTQKKHDLSYDAAGACVSYMDSIRGSIIWIAFIEGDGEIRVRLRSRFVTINKLAEKYGGGGHDCASGARVKSKREMRSLLADADALIKKYKSENNGWM